MAVQLGDKSIACLRIARLESRARGVAYEQACKKWSEKAVIRAFEKMVDKGYIECGVSARTGWLTDKGRAVLESIDQQPKNPQ